MERKKEGKREKKGKNKGKNRKNKLKLVKKYLFLWGREFSKKF